MQYVNLKRIYIYLVAMESDRWKYLTQNQKSVKFWYKLNGKLLVHQWWQWRRKFTSSEVLMVYRLIKSSFALTLWKRIGHNWLRLILKFILCPSPQSYRNWVRMRFWFLEVTILLEDNHIITIICFYSIID